MPLLSWDTCILTSFAYQTLICTYRLLQSCQRMQTTYHAVLSIFLLVTTMTIWILLCATLRFVIFSSIIHDSKYQVTEGILTDLWSLRVGSPYFSSYRDIYLPHWGCMIKKNHIFVTGILWIYNLWLTNISNMATVITVIGVTSKKLVSL